MLKILITGQFKIKLLIDPQSIIQIDELNYNSEALLSKAAMEINWPKKTCLVTRLIQMMC